MIGEMIRMPLDKVKYIVIHNSGTKLSQDFGFAKCNAEHINVRKFACIGYHYYIEQDGNIFRGRPFSLTGQHCKKYNNCSVAVCLEGGLDEDGNPADTRTDDQIISLNYMVDLLHRIFPHAKIVGHCYLDSKHKDPCFDVSKEYAKYKID